MAAKGGCLLVAGAVAAAALALLLAPGLLHETSLGVDLGTTFSVAAVCSAGVVTVVQVGGRPTLPSVVSYPPAPGGREAPLVGAPASAARPLRPFTTVFGAKRLIGRPLASPEVAAEAAHLPYALAAGPHGEALLDLWPGRAPPVAPSDVAARLLAALKAAAEAQAAPGGRVGRALGFRFGSATVSVPVGFGPAQRRATLEAARMAGFRMTRLLEEPVAAALAYGLDRGGGGFGGKGGGGGGGVGGGEGGAPADRLVLVYDLGGGTLDVALLRLDPGSRTFLVLSTAGDPRLGGEDFDRALAAWATNESAAAASADDDAADAAAAQPSLGDAADGAGAAAAAGGCAGGGGGEGGGGGGGGGACGVQQPQQPAGAAAAAAAVPASGGDTARLLAAVEAAKRALGDADAVPLELPQPWGGGGGADAAPLSPPPSPSHRRRQRPPLSLTQGVVESACAELLARCAAPVGRALAAAGVAPGDVGDVVLVGGGSRLAAVRRAVARQLAGRALHTGLDPDTAIAVGAARAYNC